MPHIIHLYAEAEKCTLCILIDPWPRRHHWLHVPLDPKPQQLLLQPHLELLPTHQQALAAQSCLEPAMLLRYLMRQQLLLYIAKNA